MSRPLRIGINGLGRIGRSILRQWYKNQQQYSFEIVALNNPGSRETYAHLLKYDSVHKVLEEVDIEYSENTLLLKNKLSSKTHKMNFYDFKDPTQIPWSDSGVDFVIDSTGVFKDKKGLSAHKTGSVQKVMMCAPGKELDGTFVMGVNHQTYNHKEHHIISNASCTTNCLAPLAKILHDTWKIESGLMTTVHSYTSDQQLLDSSHSDWRRARAAGLSMIPTTTGAAKTVGKVIPDLQGKLDGIAIRVPTPNVSLVDFCVLLKTTPTVEEINQKLKEEAEGAFKGIIQYCSLPLVSQDFLGSPYSSIVDSLSTAVLGKQIKVFAWYDNEIGYSCRVLDLTNYVANNWN